MYALRCTLQVLGLPLSLTAMATTCYEQPSRALESSRKQIQFFGGSTYPEISKDPS